MESSNKPEGSYDRDMNEPAELESQLRARRDLGRNILQVRTGIVLTGHVRDGKVELDQETLDDIAKRFGNANTSFLAVNAPFDPQPALK